MKRLLLSIVFMFFIGRSWCQKGFPKQFQATLNISSQNWLPLSGEGVQQLVYDYEHLRARIDMPGWRTQQKQTYIIKYKPEGAEAGSPSSQGYTIFSFNPDYPEFTKNKCWYRTDPMNNMGPFPIDWFSGAQYQTKMQPWFPLPTNLIEKGQQWIPEIQQYATRYDSPEICNLKKSGIGKIPCLSYFETKDRPVKTIQAKASEGFYSTDEYISTTYLSFTHGISSQAEQLFNLLQQWSSNCGNANTGFIIDPERGFVVTPNGGDQFKLKLQTPPVHALGDEVKIEFKIQASSYFNGRQCAKFSPVIFNRDNWQKPQKVDMSFVEYGCCNYLITATGGGYDWQYTPQSFVVYACDGTPGYGCNGNDRCGK